MRKNRIIYLLFVLAGVYLAILYDEYISLVILLLLLVMPLISLLCFPFWRKQIKVRSSSSETIIKMGEECKFIIQLTNQSIFPVTNGTLQVNYRNQLDEDFQEKNIRFQLDGKGSQKIIMTFYGKHCGMLEFFCDDIFVYDYFGRHSIKIKNKQEKKKKVEVMVVPDYEYTDEQLEEEIGSEKEHSLDIYGEDNSEVKGIREYRQGDALKHIHWKLSSKQKQLMVKEFTSERSERERFVFSMVYEKKEEVCYEWYDEKMDELVNVSMSMLLEQRPHEVVWYHPKGNYFETTKIDAVEDIGYLVERVIREGIGKKTESYELLLKDYLLSHRGAI